ncbi:MAG TPA: UBP-type zinc finger domain-containing protein [Acidimicrobiia bacterium]|nr:UBP-type zinc finger domain-containing protein [Acidimicrobiia bacterium]
MTLMVGNPRPRRRAHHDNVRLGNRPPSTSLRPIRCDCRGSPHATAGSCMTAQTCDHFESLRSAVAPGSDVCEQCVAAGDTWVHLRSCLMCGNVGCCDNSVNQHARKHWEGHQHQLITSIEPGESWRYCFEHQLFIP